MIHWNLGKPTKKNPYFHLERINPMKRNPHYYLERMIVTSTWRMLPEKKKQVVNFHIHSKTLKCLTTEKRRRRPFIDHILKESARTRYFLSAIETHV